MNNQIAKKFQEYFIQSHWTEKYIESLILEPSEPIDYPNSLMDINNCIDFLGTNLQNKKILVIGSISPWIETFLLYKGAKNIYVTDVNELQIDSNKIIFLKEDNLSNFKFDLIVSYSSIEHIGLGRYGDKINENGGIEYLKFLYDLINEGSHLLISIPVSEIYKVDGNWHRIYDKKRIQKLFLSYKIIMSSKNGVLNDDIDYTFDNSYSYDWQNQPTVLLKKL
jgi:hypothetical protein